MYLRPILPPSFHADVSKHVLGGKKTPLMPYIKLFSLQLPVWSLMVLGCCWLGCCCQQYVCSWDSSCPPFSGLVSLCPYVIFITGLMCPSIISSSFSIPLTLKMKIMVHHNWLPLTYSHSLWNCQNLQNVSWCMLDKKKQWLLGKK